MSSTVSVQIANNQTGKNVNMDIPINGRQEKIVAIFGSSFGNQVKATTISVQKPGQAQGVEIRVGPTNGPYTQLNSNGTPFNINDGKELDISDWVIGATKS